MPRYRVDHDYLTANALAVGEETIPRQIVNANGVATGNQSLRLTFFTARKSETTTQVRIWTGGTPAAATPTLARIGLYTVDASGNIALAASTANDTTLFAAASTSYTRSWSASYYKRAGLRYALGVLVVTAVQAPTLMGGGAQLSSTEILVAPSLSGTVGSQADLPASVAVGSISANSVWFYGVVLP